MALDEHLRQIPCSVGKKGVNERIQLNAFPPCLLVFPFLGKREAIQSRKKNQDQEYKRGLFHFHPLFSYSLLIKPQGAKYTKMKLKCSNISHSKPSSDGPAEVNRRVAHPTLPE